ncbi:MAG TPA: ABC transporter permease [Stellaceae bacterium]|jgi:ABC-type nitrate/sulfonate/bicarbonate transport system permease component|nr:ABC transporter permease [Stellaceae bacterium]
MSTAAETRAPSEVLPRLYAGAAILILWQVVVRAFAPAYVATPLGIVAAIPHVLTDPAFLTGGVTTLLAVAEGLVIAVLVGTATGLVIGRSTLADRALRQYVNAGYTLPMIVVLPLVSLWFGYTGAARLATVVFAAVFSITVNVADGARAVPHDYIEVARAFRSPPWRALIEIVLPASAPYVFAGIRLAAGRALIGAVVAEFFTAIPGLGYFILYNSRTFHHNEAFVAVLLLAAFGVGCDALVNWATRRYLPWYRRGEHVE